MVEAIVCPCYRILCVQFGLASTFEMQTHSVDKNGAVGLSHPTVDVKEMFAEVTKSIESIAENMVGLAAERYSFEGWSDGVIREDSSS